MIAACCPFALKQVVNSMNPPPIYIEDPDRPGHNLYEEVRAIAVYLWRK
jgi:hypothetical protein